MTYEALRINNDYEICTEFPHLIRKRSNGRIVKEYIENNGYLRLNLSETVNGRRVQRKYHKHKLIALQFIPNPDDLDYVDHINRNKLDNRINNLRWVSASDNSRNRTSHKGHEYEYVDEIPNDSIVVNDYGAHTFENYYYVLDEDCFYYYNGRQYRRLRINEERNGTFHLYVLDTNGKQVKIYLSKFKRLYGLQ